MFIERSFVRRHRHRPATPFAVYRSCAGGCPAIRDVGGQGTADLAQWELAARGGVDGPTNTWEDKPEPSGAALANLWHGSSPGGPTPDTGRRTGRLQHARTPTGCSMRPATSGSGPPTGSPHATRTTRAGAARRSTAWRLRHGAAASPDGSPGGFAKTAPPIPRPSWRMPQPLTAHRLKRSAPAAEAHR
jgi:hypothetical protein